MFSAHAQLADAYLAAGAATEARFIAEDLVAREPWDKSNIERFRRALELLGEPDPDALIAQRLSGESPFTSTDLFAEPPSDERSDAPDSSEAAAREAPVDPALLAAAAAADEPRKKRPPKPREERGSHFTLSANAVDLDGILGDFESPAMAHAASDDVEVDLSIMVDDIKPAPAPRPGAREERRDLDSVFGQMREKAAQRAFEEAEKEYKRGLALRDAGDIDGCIRALEIAARSPKLRFATAWLIARLYRDRKMTAQAIEWLEQASQASAPTSTDAHRLLYELADGLEQTGEVARALGVCLELQADGAAYADLAERIDRLAKVQARG
jgi:tetratricopeptide (TPR) repeat protein